MNLQVLYLQCVYSMCSSLLFLLCDIASSALSVTNDDTGPSSSAAFAWFEACFCCHCKDHMIKLVLKARSDVMALPAWQHCRLCKCMVAVVNGASITYDNITASLIWCQPLHIIRGLQCCNNEDAAAYLHLSLIMFLLLCGSCLLLKQIRVRVQQRIVASLELPINLSDLQCNHDVSFRLHVLALTQANSCVQGTPTPLSRATQVPLQRLSTCV